MESEFQVLNSIEKVNSATQRDIAKRTGMSLGNVNVLIKRLVTKGLVKIERLSPKTIRYILTPQGMKQKTESTYRYVIESYRFINDMNLKIDKLLHNEMDNKGERFILLGKADEIYEILKNRIQQYKVNYLLIQTIEEFTAEIEKPENQDSMVLIWQPEYISNLSTCNCKYVNLLDVIN